MITKQALVGAVINTALGVTNAVGAVKKAKPDILTSLPASLKKIAATTAKAKFKTATITKPNPKDTYIKTRLYE